MRLTASQLDILGAIQRGESFAMRGKWRTIESLKKGALITYATTMTDNGSGYRLTDAGREALAGKGAR